MQSAASSSSQALKRAFTSYCFNPAPLFLAMIFAFGCGGGGGSMSSSAPMAAATPTPSPGSTSAPTSVQVNFGGGPGNAAAPGSPASPTSGTSSNPSDWVITFTMTMGSMSLNNVSGGSVTVASGPVQMEMRHLMGVVHPVAMPALPQGTYASATFNISAASVIYIQPSTKLLLQANLPAVTKTLSFNPPLTVGPQAATMNFDLDLGQSLTVDSGGNLHFAPVFNMTSGAPGVGLDEIVGSVSSVSGSGFTVALMQGLQSVTCSTNSGTQFVGTGGASTGLQSMAMGMMVEVDAAWQADGSCMAARVEPLLSGACGGLMAEGMLFSITGAPPTQLSIIVDNGAGGAMMNSYLGTRPLVNVSAATTYSFDSDGVNLTNLPFTPAFDPEHMTLGQRIEPQTTGGMMADPTSAMGPKSMNANAITLEQQSMRGAVAGYGGGVPASFTLTLPAGSGFASLTGAASITVYQQPDTLLRGMTSVSDGANVQVRGLLFFDQGAYKLVATQILAD
jgi:Domain of unknown function (DUF5666)